MSPASYLTAPPRGVARIVAPSLRWSPMWDWAIWAALVARHRWRESRRLAPLVVRSLRGLARLQADTARGRRRSRRVRCASRGGRGQARRRRAARPSCRKASAACASRSLGSTSCARRSTSWTAPSDAPPRSSPTSDRRRGRPRDEHHAASRRRLSRTAASRSCTARRGSRGSARASTRAAASSPSRSPASVTRSPTTAAPPSRSAPSGRCSIATSAVRDAENGEAFLGEIEWSYGFATRLLSGDEEAGLTQRGVGDLGATDAACRHRWRLDRARPRRLPRRACRWARVPLHRAARRGRGRRASQAGRARCSRSSARIGARSASRRRSRARRARPRPRAIRPRASTRPRPHARRRPRAARAARGAAARGAAARAGARARIAPRSSWRAARFCVAILDDYGLGSIRVSEHDLLDGAALAAAELPGAGGGRCASRRLHLLLGTSDPGSGSASGGSSSARRRCTTARDSTPTRRPSSSTTGTRSRSCSSRKWNALSSPRPASSVKFGGSAISRGPRRSGRALPPPPRARASSASRRRAGARRPR